MPYTPEQTELILRRLAGGGVSYLTAVPEAVLERISAIEQRAADAKRRESGWHNVRAYSAVGDGTTVDTAAVAATFAAVPATGGTVFFPPGIYIVEDLTPPSNTRLLGSGQAWTTLKTKAGTNASAINHLSLDNVEICDMTIDGNKAAQTSTDARGIVLAISTNCAIRRVTVRDTYGRGIQIYQGSDITIEQCRLDDIGQGTGSDGLRGGIFTQGTTRVAILGNTVDGVGDVGIIANDAEDIRIANNAVSNAFFIGIGLGAGTGGLTVIEGNTIRDCGDNGIDTGDVCGVVVSHNSIDTTLSGIVCDSSGLVGDTNLALQYSSNVIRNVANWGILIGGPGGVADTEYGYGCVVADNVIDTCEWHGVTLSGIRETTVSGNTVRNFSGAGVGYSGLYLDEAGSGCQGIVVTGNRFYDSADGYGINRGGGGAGAQDNNYNIYVGNSTRGCATDFAGVAGPNDVQANNI